ncbi:hypothetical protein CSOJ01_10490 [Colletotrichum sojae]|uniref:Uncharacterized protein n=1 Tax=Colletotrichum sojae TaxID=2175907 RepID=A0A8H6J0S1_9PEZI|nr:hypothetical protein CSOJ01_10490 [Colletotrichum sojae]
MMTNFVGKSYNGPTRTTSISFTSTDIFHVWKDPDPTRAIFELETVLRSGKKKDSSKCLIIADEITSWMVMEIHGRTQLGAGFLGKGRHIAGFFYLECEEHLRQPHQTQSSRVASQLSGLHRRFLDDVFKSFLEDTSDPKTSPCYSQRVEVSDHPERNKDNLENVRQTLEKLLDKYIKSDFSWSTPAVDSGCSTLAVGAGDRILPVSSRNALRYTAHLSYPRVARRIAFIERNSVEYTPQFRDVYAGGGMSPVPTKDALQYPSQLTWNDPQTTERIARVCIRNGNPKRALSVLETYKDENGPAQIYSLSMSMSRATALRCLGRLTEAREESRRASDRIESEMKHSDIHRPSFMDLKEEAIYNYTDARFHLGHYDHILGKDSSGGPLLIQDPSQAFSPLTSLWSIGTLRLKALAVAHLGFHENPTLEPELVIDVARERLIKLKESLRSVNTNGEPTESDADSHGNLVDGKPNYELMAMEISLGIAQAKIQMLRGEYDNSMSLIAIAFDEAARLLGETNPWTLQAALDTCHICLLTSNVTKAADIAHKSMAIVSKQFGVKSLLAIEGASALISVYEAEGRLAYALDSCLELCAAVDSNSDLAPDHTLSLRCKWQLGKLHIRCGNFAEAETILQSASSNLERIWSSKYEHMHPMFPAFQSQLALAKYHMGKIDEAKHVILPTLIKQLEDYERISGKLLWDGPAADTRKEILDQIRSVLRDNTREGTRAQKHKLHPDILNTALVFVKIEAIAEDSDVGWVIEVLHMIRTAAMKKLGESSELTLDASITLGNLLSSIDPTKKSELCGNMGLSLESWTHEYYFEFVISQAIISGPNGLQNGGRADAETEKPDGDEKEGTAIARLTAGSVGIDVYPNLGIMYHPTILRAIQESIAADIVLDEEASHENDPMQRKQQIEFLVRMQETRPGWNHLDTLRSMLIMLASQLSSTDSFKNIQRTCDDLRQRLQKPEVRSQRLFSCLQLEEGVAQLLMTRVGEFQDDIEALLQSIQDDSERYLAQQDDVVLKETLTGLRCRCQETLSQLRNDDRSAEDSDPDRP